jgi:hypothetical protein
VALSAVGHFCRGLECLDMATQPIGSVVAQDYPFYALTL